MSKKPAIAYVLPWSIDGHGGVNEVVRNLIRQTLRDRNYQPILVDTSWATSPEADTQLVPHTVLKRRIRGPYVKGQTVRSIIGFLVYLIPDVFFWLSWVHRNRVSTINVHYVTGSMLTLAIVRKLFLRKTSFILSVHGMDLTTFSTTSGMERCILSFIYNSSDRIVACSDHLAKRMRASLPDTDTAKVVTIHNGIDVDAIDLSVKESAPTPPAVEPPYIINVATYEHKKGQDVLVTAFKQLVDRGFPHNLVFVGRRTPFVEQLNAHIRQLGVSRRVQVFSGMDHAIVLRLIRDSALFVLPSRIEPFGIVLLEAAYLDVPIVATRTGGIPEVLGGNYEYLVPADDSTSLAETMGAVLGNSDTSARRRLKSRVQEHFGWATAFRKYSNLFREATPT